MQATQLAGQIIATGYDQTHEIDAKGVGDLVSDIDRRADRVMTDFLAEHSDAVIISEELNPDVQPVPDACWIIDPLDASSAFLLRAGRQYPSVLACKYEAGQVIAGIVFFPLTGERFYAVAGKGAWKDGQPLKLNNDSMELSEAWVEMNQYGDSALETEVFSQLRLRLRSSEGARLVTSNVPHAGVAMRIAEANSSLAVAIHDNQASSVKQGPWDIAAPKLILEEAGGTVMGLDGQAVDPFGGQPFLLSRSKQLATAVLRLVPAYCA